MDIATIISLCTAGAGAITAIILIILKGQEVTEKAMSIKEKREKKKEVKLNSQQERIIKALNIVLEPVTKEIKDINCSLSALSAQLDEVKADVTKQNTTLMYLVKDNINCAHKKFISQGYIDRYSLDILEHLYESYVSLGGNSFVSDLMEDIRRLDIR